MSLEITPERSPAYDDPSDWKRFAKDDQPREWDDLDLEEKEKWFVSWCTEYGNAIDLAEAMVTHDAKATAKLSRDFNIFVNEKLAE